MSAEATFYRRGRRTLAHLDLDRLARPALGVAVVASGLLLFHLSRGTSFWVDDWNFIVSRRGNSVSVFLSPYQGHLSVVPIAIYRVLFATFGISSYTPYRTLVILLSLVVAIVLFAYARRRIGDLSALLLATLMLFLGPGWQNTIWAFQISWLIVAAAGIAALMALDRRDRRGDFAACVLILVAICSTSIGVAFAIGIAVDIALIRRRWRDAWIVAIPLALYAIWALHYHPTAVAWVALPVIPINIAQGAAAGLSALVGLSGIAPFSANGTAYVYGLPLLILALTVVAWLAARGRVTARAVSLFVILATFVAMVTLIRAGAAFLLSSRYLYFYCLLVALLIAELGRGIRLSLPVQAALCALCILAVVSNVGSYRAFGLYIRESGAQTNSALGALDLDRRTVPPNTLARIALYPTMRLPAGAYFAAADALGTPAYSVGELLHADAIGQSAADSQLLGDGDVTLAPAAVAGAAGPAARTGAAPAVLTSSNGTVTDNGACLRFTPAAALAPGSAASVSLIAHPGQLSVTVAAAPATLSVRRFAATFTPLGTAAAPGSTIVTIQPDAAPNPWYLEVSSIAPVRVCAR